MENIRGFSMTYQGCLYAGTSTIIAVPLPSLDSTVRVPPRSLARTNDPLRLSRFPAQPPENCLGTIAPRESAPRQKVSQLLRQPAEERLKEA